MALFNNLLLLVVLVVCPQPQGVQLLLKLKQKVGDVGGGCGERRSGWGRGGGGTG
jgi:hypothetical protein